MPLIFILNVYDEYGPEKIRATADPSKMVEILDNLLAKEKADLDGKTWRDGYVESRLGYHAECRANLKDFLKSPEIGGQDLGDGWGGYQIHAAEIE